VASLHLIINILDIKGVNKTKIINLKIKIKIFI